MYNGYVVEKLKIYGFLINKNGLEIDESWDDA